MATALAVMEKTTDLPAVESSWVGTPMGWRPKYLLCAVLVSYPAAIVPLRDLNFATGSFLPMTLEQLAREVGVLHADKTTPCTGSTQTPRHSSQPSLTARDENQCIVDLFGYELNTSSFTLYSFSLAIVVQTLVLISIGAISDYGIVRPWQTVVLIVLII